MLTPRDLEAIRKVVRDELKRVLGTDLPRASVAALGLSPEDDARDVVRAFSRATASRMRGEPGAEDRELMAEARYRLLRDESYQRRARKWLGKAADEPITLDEMERALRAWKARAAKAAKHGDEA